MTPRDAKTCVVLDVEAGKTTQHKGTELVAGIEAELVPGKPLQLVVNSPER